MRAESNPKPPVDFHHDRFTQISESHCGPAVIQMLLHNLGIGVDQEAIAEAGGASGLIAQQGIRVDQLNQAVRQLAPQTHFWYKDHSKIEELVQIVTEYDYPVGIEWQGLFEDTLEDETQDGDYGHYSLVTMADSKSRKLVIVDPYKDFRLQDRVFTFDFFVSRWWDVNDFPDQLTGKDHPVEDRQMMFIITPEEVAFPQLLGMKRD
jgi:Peptidase_C39 like family